MTALDAVRQRREAVLEDDHVVVVGGDLGRPTRRGRAQRALVGGWQVGAGLSVAGDDHPLVDQHVIADLRGGVRGGKVAPVGLRAVDARLLVEVEQLAVVGEPDHRLGHVRHHLDPLPVRFTSPSRVLRRGRARMASAAGRW
jgi:hypothetical protein